MGSTMVQLVQQCTNELGIPTPANDAVTELDRQINRGEITMDAANYARLQARVGATPA